MNQANLTETNQPANQKTVGNLTLRKSEAADLETFFLNQADAEACYMAAFTAKDPNDKIAYLEKWTGILQNKTINMQTILLDGVIAGSVLTYEMEGETQVSYWIGKEYWGRGIATQALAFFLQQVKKRPLFGRAAKDNLRSQRVLEKCGFEITGHEQGFANARGKVIEEVVYTLVK